MCLRSLPMRPQKDQDNTHKNNCQAVKLLRNLRFVLARGLGRRSVYRFEYVFIYLVYVCCSVYKHVDIGGCAQAHACGGRPEKDWACLPLLISSFFLGARPLTEPRTWHFNETSWPVSSQDLSTPQPWLQAHDTLPRFYVKLRI